MKSIKRKLAGKYGALTNLAGRATGRCYFEDFVRVYPDGVAYHMWGLRKNNSRHDRLNFLNHQKFYSFAGQFAADRKVVDVGCGSGHGCEVLNRAGAAQVHGCDISRHSIAFARRRYPGVAQFSRQGITGMSGYADDSFDIAVASEVLEHIREYGREREALAEIKRITRDGGLVVISSPNTELSHDHGFDFEELDQLMRESFDQYLIFENALVPPDPAQRTAWQERLRMGRTGLIVSCPVELDEVPSLPAEPALKNGAPPGMLSFASFEVDTALLHNTHSWVVLATSG